MVAANPHRRLKQALSVLSVTASAIMLAACTTTGPSASSQKHSNEYFSAAEYGVPASPRVTSKRSRLPRREGRAQLGQPYKVHGKWYYPKENRDYKAVGAASWYGDAFHGRLTANGEIYDMNRLTAAHPTMPLPSYARVTNFKDGSSVVVRVNDRGPYAQGRVIDLSKRAAEMLDYSTAGVAKVKVQYIGPAPLEPNDDSYLMASYHPGKNATPLPGENIATGVMVAMNGSTPTSSRHAVPFPGQLDSAGLPTGAPAPRPDPQVQMASAATAEIFDGSDPVLPAVGPIVPERPLVSLAAYGTAENLPVMGYAESRVARASQALDALTGHQTMTPADVVASWKRFQPVNADEGAYISVGTFASAEQGRKQALDLAAYGRPEVEASTFGSKVVYSVNLYPNGRASLDEMLQQAWNNGAKDAMTVRE